MLLQTLLLLFLLIFLFWQARKISASLYSLIFLISKSKKFSVGVLSFILLPGTIVHELSHFFIAIILRVPTGNLTVFPTIEENNQIKAGKLEIGNTDPFRHSLIGLAPIIIGLLIICFIGNLFLSNFQLITYNLQLTTIIGLYFLVTISLTMFSSRKDVESLAIALPIVILITVSLYLIGVRVFVNENLFKTLERIISLLNKYLAVTAITDYLIFIFLKLNIALWQKILGRKIIKN